MLIQQNKELQATVILLQEQMKAMAQGFTKLQNFVEDKVSKLEVENTELKNKLLNMEKQQAPSIYSSFTNVRASIDNRKEETT